MDFRLAQDFYDSGGDMTDWSKAKKDAFFAAGLNLGAMLALPEYADRKEWNDARAQYKNVVGAMEKIYGDDISEKMDHYYGMEDRDAARFFLDTHPEVQQAMDFQKSTIVNSPLLYEYYGGVETLEKVHKGRVYDQLDQEFPNIQSTLDEYYDIYDQKARTSFKKQHPELTSYWDRKTKLTEQAMKDIVNFAQLLPEAPKPQSTGNAPQTPAQEDLQNYLQAQKPSFEQWSQIMGAPLTQLVIGHAQGDELPRIAESELDYMSEQYGYEDGDQLLRDILISLGYPIR
jgi:hypothetical protein